MKVALTAVIGLAASLGAAQDHRHLGKISWERDPSAGLARAKSEKRAALLYFTAEW